MARACPTQMRSWLGGKKGPESAPPAPSASSSAAGGAPRYTANTIEAQLRQVRVRVWVRVWVRVSLTLSLTLP